MYKNCYVTRGDEWNHYNMHLWTDAGYSVEQFQNYGYIECEKHQATHRGVLLFSRFGPVLTGLSPASLARKTYYLTAMH